MAELHNPNRFPIRNSKESSSRDDRLFINVNNKQHLFILCGGEFLSDREIAHGYFHCYFDFLYIEKIDKWKSGDHVRVDRYRLCYWYKRGN